MTIHILKKTDQIMVIASTNRWKEWTMFIITILIGLFPWFTMFDDGGLVEIIFRCVFTGIFFYFAIVNMSDFDSCTIDLAKKKVSVSRKNLFQERHYVAEFGQLWDIITYEKETSVSGRNGFQIVFELRQQMRIAITETLYLDREPLEKLIQEIKNFINIPLPPKKGVDINFHKLPTTNAKVQTQQQKQEQREKEQQEDIVELDEEDDEEDDEDDETDRYDLDFHENKENKEKNEDKKTTTTTKEQAKPKQESKKKK